MDNRALYPIVPIKRRCAGWKPTFRCRSCSPMCVGRSVCSTGTAARYAACLARYWSRLECRSFGLSQEHLSTNGIPTWWHNLECLRTLTALTRLDLAVLSRVRRLLPPTTLRLSSPTRLLSSLTDGHLSVVWSWKARRLQHDPIVAVHPSHARQPFDSQFDAHCRAGSSEKPSTSTAWSLIVPTLLPASQPPRPQRSPTPLLTSLLPKPPPSLDRWRSVSPARWQQHLSTTRPTPLRMLPGLSKRSGPLVRRPLASAAEARARCTLRTQWLLKTLVCQSLTTSYCRSCVFSWVYRAQNRFQCRIQDVMMKRWTMKWMTPPMRLRLASIGLLLSTMDRRIPTANLTAPWKLGAARWLT